MSDATYLKEINENARGKDYFWEKPNVKIHGLRNPIANYNRIMFLPESNGVLVCWVNVQQGSHMKSYVNKKRTQDL